MQEQIDGQSVREEKVTKELEYYKRLRDEMLAFQSDEVSKAILDSHVYKEKIDQLKEELYGVKKQNKELERYQCLYNQLKENEDKRQKELLWAKAEQECAKEAEMVSISGHLKNPGYNEKQTIFALVTSQFLGLRDHIKVMSLSKKTTQMYLEHNYQVFINIFAKQLHSFNIKYKEL